MLVYLVSVCCLKWFSEEKRYAVGYSDGQVWLLSKDNYSSNTGFKVTAHKVILKLAFYFSSAYLFVICEKSSLYLLI